MTTEVNKIISGVSNVALKLWLRRNGFKHSAANEDALVAVLADLMEKEKLSVQQLKEGVREIKEYGSKRVYLKQMADPKIVSDKRSFEGRLNEHGLKLDAEPGEPARTSVRPRLDYAVWLEGEVRMRFSEQHVHVKSDKKRRQYIEEPTTNIIVLSVEQASGFVKIFLDPPGDEHPHVDDRGNMTDAAYTRHYFEQAEKFFGELADFDLLRATSRLLKLDPPVYEPVHDTGWTVDNYQYTFKGRSDVRSCQAHRASAGGNATPGIPELIRGSWLKSASGDQLERDLFMTIKPTESKLQFRADCLAREVNYAISRIRSV